MPCPPPPCTQARGAQRQQLWARVQARFWAGFAAAYVVVLGYAAWVRHTALGCAQLPVHTGVHTCPSWVHAPARPRPTLRARHTCAQVLRQPPGRFTAAQHSARVAPVLLTPLVAFLLHAALRWLAGALGRRDARRLRQLEARLRKMVGELKVGGG